MKTDYYQINIFVLKWQIVFDDRYKVSECRKLINTHTGRVIKETVVGYTVGFWIGRKFIAKKKLNNFVEIIPEYNLPF